MAESDAKRKKQRDALVAAFLLAWQSGDWQSADDDAQQAINAIAGTTASAFGLSSLDADPAWRQFLTNVRHYLGLHADLTGEAAQSYAALVVTSELQNAALALARVGAQRTDSQRIRRITHPEATASGPCPTCLALEGEHDADSPEAFYSHPSCACEIQPIGSPIMAARQHMTMNLALFKDYSVAERRDLAKKGFALSDGSFPIANVDDLKNAIHRIGTTKHAKSTVIAHIRKRAKALGAEDELGPETGGEDNESDDKAKNALEAPDMSLQVAGFAADGSVTLTGKVFELGDFPDKNFSLNEQEADDLAATFLGAPVDLGHPETASPLDGNLGSWTAFRREGNDIYGTVEIPAFVREAAGDGPIRVSVAWDRASKLPVALSFVNDPRITDAALMAAFARHDTYSGQMAMQDAHDNAVRHGAVCKRPQANMASRHEADANQQIHDLAADHGAKCDGNSGARVMYAQQEQAAAQPAKGKSMSFKDKVVAWFALGQPEDFDPGAEPATPYVAPENSRVVPAPVAAAASATFSVEQRLLQAEADLSRERMARADNEALTFAEGEIDAERSTPAERDGLIALYRQAFEDDLKLGVVKFGDSTQMSRTAQLKAVFGMRDRRLMTQELMATFSPDVLRNVMKTMDASKPKPMDENEYNRLMGMTPAGQTALQNRAGK